MALATYDDANLLLRLYELRREEKLREARAWFVANFKPKSFAEFNELCPPGSENNARMRMVVTYWEMAACFVTTGVLNDELFFTNNRESLIVWLRMRHTIQDMRATFKDPSYLKNLEILGERFKEYLDHISPEAYNTFVARLGG